MKGIFKKWQFWAVVIVILLIALPTIIEWLNEINAKNTINGSRGGILDGPSHENGGIGTIVRKTGEKLELEGGEAIINKNSMSIPDKVFCEGTPSGIASEINELGGGVEFDKGGKCLTEREIQLGHYNERHLN